MEYPILILLHVAFGVVWAGGAISIGFFIIPSVLDAGPAGGAVMAGVAKRKLPIFLTVSAAMVVLTGLRMYMVRFSPGWVATPEGIVLSLGALAGLGAFVIGFFVQKPTVERMGALAGKIAASGAPPSAADAAELQALRTRLRKVAIVTAWHLLVAATLMAAHRLAALL